MADAAIAIRWNRVVPGREKQGLSIFGQSLEYYGTLQRKGAIESFEPVIFQPDGWRPQRDHPHPRKPGPTRCAQARRPVHRSDDARGAQLRRPRCERRLSRRRAPIAHGALDADHQPVIRARGATRGSTDGATCKGGRRAAGRGHARRPSELAPIGGGCSLRPSTVDQRRFQRLSTLPVPASAPVIGSGCDDGELGGLRHVLDVELLAVPSVLPDRSITFGEDGLFDVALGFPDWRVLADLSIEAPGRSAANACVPSGALRPASPTRRCAG